jgi:diguanylate cyclase (GGDEF)-like protein
MLHARDQSPEPHAAPGTDGLRQPLATSASRPSKILVVDDEAAVRRLIVDILRLDGYEVSEASDGEEALRQLAGARFDVVLTDMVMPRMDGLTLLHTARQLGHQTAYIVMTAYSSWDSAVAAIKAGAEDYLPKPCHIELLRLVVARTLGKRRLEERARQAELYEKLAHTDGLTNLYNYRFFQQLLSVEMSRARRFQRPLSLIMLDIDHFKLYNDVYGHQAGDHALRHLATLLRRSSRSYDLVARYGGEEFAIILPETGKGTAAEVAERIRACVEQLGPAPDERLPGGPFTISLGIASFPEDASDTGDLLLKADRALYQAKARGRNRLYSYQRET